jgi:hypothetical protein
MPPRMHGQISLRVLQLSCPASDSHGWRAFLRVWPRRISDSRRRKRNRVALSYKKSQIQSPLTSWYVDDRSYALFHETYFEAQRPQEILEKTHKTCCENCKGIAWLYHGICPIISENLVECCWDSTKLQFLQVYQRALAFFSTSYPGFRRDVRGCRALDLEGSTGSHHGRPMPRASQRALVRRRSMALRVADWFGHRIGCAGGNDVNHLFQFALWCGRLNRKSAGLGGTVDRHTSPACVPTDDHPTQRRGG